MSSRPSARARVQLDAALAATIAYLRFPLRGEHRSGLCDGSRCPHCPGTRVHKWGRFAGRQRFRCRDCRRTFSTFTGTPLRYLKRADRWRAFLWCMEGRLTVRLSGAVVGIDKNTALRWRHRVLDHWRVQPHRRLRGSLAVGEFWMPLNEKGRCCRGRRPRRRGHAPGRATPDLEWVGLIASIETNPEGVPDQWIGLSNVRVLGRANYAVLLAPRIGPIVEIIGDRGRLCPLATFARSVGAEYRPDRNGVSSVVPRGRELRRWLRPFRGVATHRLENYLEWFRRGVSADLADALPAPHRQQLPQTEPEGHGSVRAAVRARAAPVAALGADTGRSLVEQ